MMPARLRPVMRVLPTLLVLLLGAASVAAQEAMKFERISPESARAMERTRRTAAVPAAPAMPPAPRVPGVPPAPEPPRIERSGDLMRIGSDIHVEEGEVVDGDVFALGGDVRVDGHVRGNVASTGGNVTLGSSALVDGDVMCIGGVLTEEEGAKVHGQKVTAAPGRRLDREIREKIRRQVHENIDDAKHPWKAAVNAERLAASLAWLIILLAAAWVAARLAPGRTGVAVDTLRREPGMSFVVGLIVVLLLVPSLIAMALVVAILCITIIGIPLAVGVAIGYFVVIALLGCWGLVVGLIPLGQAAGRRVGAAVPDLSRAAMYGVLAVAGLGFFSALLHFLPLFGGVATLLKVISILATCGLGLVGVGALLRSKLGQGPEGQWWPLVRRPSPIEPVAPVAAPGAWTSPVPTAPVAPPPPAAPPPPSPPAAFRPPVAPEPPPPTG